jgi:hypothetical protein
MKAGTPANPLIKFKPDPLAPETLRASYLTINAEITRTRNKDRPWRVIIDHAGGPRHSANNYRDLQGARERASEMMRRVQKKAWRIARLAREAEAARIAADSEEQREILSEAQCQRDMLQGWSDGRRRDTPPPGDTASASYRHGFAARRADCDDATRTPAQWRAMAAAAIAQDMARGAP